MPAVVGYLGVALRFDAVGIGRCGDDFRIVVQQQWVGDGIREFREHELTRVVRQAQQAVFLVPGLRTLQERVKSHDSRTSVAVRREDGLRFPGVVRTSLWMKDRQGGTERKPIGSAGTAQATTWTPFVRRREPSRKMDRLAAPPVPPCVSFIPHRSNSE